jgi:hypothetical protein
LKLTVEPLAKPFSLAAHRFSTQFAAKALLATSPILRTVHAHATAGLRKIYIIYYTAHQNVYTPWTYFAMHSRTRRPYKISDHLSERNALVHVLH